MPGQPARTGCRLPRSNGFEVRRRSEFTISRSRRRLSFRGNTGAFVRSLLPSEHAPHWHRSATCARDARHSQCQRNPDTRKKARTAMRDYIDLERRSLFAPMQDREPSEMGRDRLQPIPSASCMIDAHYFTFASSRTISCVEVMLRPGFGCKYSLRKASCLRHASSRCSRCEKPCSSLG